MEHDAHPRELEVDAAEPCQRCVRDRLRAIVAEHSQDGQIPSVEIQEEFRRLGQQLVLEPGEIFDVENVLRILREDPVH